VQDHETLFNASFVMFQVDNHSNNKSGAYLVTKVHKIIDPIVPM
jgi:hypothetical protein